MLNQNTIRVSSLKKLLPLFLLSGLCLLGGALILNAKKASDADKLDGHDWSEVQQIQNKVNQIEAKGFSVGDYKFSAQKKDHDGWLICNGRNVSRTQYAELFKVIGIDFGEGNKTTTFALPDGRSRVAGAVGKGSGLSTRSVGQRVGAETHKLSTGELPSHKHGYYDVIHSEHQDHLNKISNSNDKKKFTKYSNPSKFGSNGGTDKDNVGFQLKRNTDSLGSNQAHNNMQPTLFVGNLFIYSGK